MQTNIDTFFKSRKRPATDELPGHSSKLVARKLFEGDVAAERSTSPAPPEPSDEPARPTTPTQSPDTQESLRQKLNLGEFRKVIRNHKKYASLKSKLNAYNKTAANLNDQSSPELKKFDSVEFEIPSSPVKCGTLQPKRLFWTSPVRSPAKQLPYVSPKKLLNEGPKLTPVKPAYDRYSFLIATGKDALVLPNKYKVLRAIFRSVDIITKIKTDRNEMVTFDRLKKDVQKMLSRNFDEKHLGQIKAVYPESYDYSRERVKATFSNEEKYELIVNRLSHTVKKDDDSEPIELTNSERLKIFQERLLNKTKIYHEEFLAKLDPPIVVESKLLKQWHPEFELENVPDVIPEPLPPVPGQCEKITAKSVLEKAHGMIVTKRMGKALVSAVERKKAAEEEAESGKSTTSSTVCPSPTPSVSTLRPALEKALKNIPKSLLEKVRARQAAKMAETMTQTPAEAKETIMLSRLPELARIMRNVFVNEKKGILPTEIVMMKISYSYREKLSHNDLMEHLKLISQHVPGWMNFCVVRNTPHVRLSKDADMTRILGKLQKLANP